MAYDILIKSGTIVDGSGTAPFFGDVAISGEQVVAMGELGNAAAKQTIQALGKHVVPGFIDVTNHSDTSLTIFKYPPLESFVMQGVTTIIGGNCGASLAPLASKSAINAIKKWADPSEINVNWATVKEFLDTLEGFKPELNFGTCVGYGTLKRGIIEGEARPLSFDEREKVKYLLRQSIVEGAFGISLGLVYGHERVSTTEELIEIIRVLKRPSVVKVHLRYEGSELLASVNEMIRIARETGISVEISHLKAIGKKAWALLPRALELILHANESGMSINFDVSPYRTTGSLLYLLVPAWARESGFQGLFQRIDNPTERKKIIEGLQSHTLHYDKILITSAKIKSIVGHTIAELAEEGGISPEEAIISTIRANEGRVTIIGKTLSEENLKLAILDTHAFIASDGIGFSQEAYLAGDLVHPRSFGAFPRYLCKFVPLLSIPIADAIRKITGGPAEKFGITRRGVLKEKNFADVVIYDPRLIKDRATYENPFRYPAGIEWVIINGTIAVENGRPLGARAGKILRCSS